MIHARVADTVSPDAKIRAPRRRAGGTGSTTGDRVVLSFAVWGYAPVRSALAIVITEPIGRDESPGLRVETVAVDFLRWQIGYGRFHIHAPKSLTRTGYHGS